MLFTCQDPDDDEETWVGAEVVDAQGRWPDGSTDFTFATFPDHVGVRISDVLEFHVHDDRIHCRLRDERHRYLVEIALFGMVYALWLERRGTPTLHAAVTTVAGDAIGFLAAKGGGKTSTLAAFLARGHALLADDLLAVTRCGNRFQAERGFPSLRLWPAQADHFLGGSDGLTVLRPDTTKVRATVGAGGYGHFAVGPAPLRRLYLPEREEAPRAGDRHESGICVERLPPALAVMTLLRHSFLPREVHRFGWQPDRLRVLAELVDAVPVLRVRYPAGLDRLPRLIEHLERDLAAAPH